MHEDIKNMIISQTSGLVNAEYEKNMQNKDFSSKELIQKVNEFLGIEAINDRIELDDVNAIKTAEEL
ncbi:MAG: hypothetical protein LBD88_03835 [Candidatus Peribacteria bacterium]|nr:hypothetical protein [Candidatus Peribacteria bacterium]